MKTKLDCLNNFLRYLDEATKKGVDLPSTKNADYRDKFNYFLNEAQIYIAGLIKIPEVYTITQNPIKNQLKESFDIQQYLPNESIVLTAIGTKSYYFEMDNIGTVHIAINGVPVKAIANTTKRPFVAYKGNTGALEGDTVTITFSGLYPYNIRNTAMYAYAFPDDEDVPEYKPYTEYPMPSNFMSFDSVVIKADERVYEQYLAYKWENNKKVILRHDDKGSFDIHYFKYPATILPSAADETQLDVEDKAIDLVVLQAGIKATASDNEDLSRYLQQIFDKLLPGVLDKEQIGETTIQTVYSMM